MEKKELSCLKQNPQAKMKFQAEIGLGNHLKNHRTGTGNFIRIKVFDKQKFNQIINLHNRRVNVYCSINPYKNIYDYSTIILKYCPLDIDKNMKTAQEIENYLLKHNIKHKINFSGSKDSYHFYVFLKQDDVENPKMSLYNTQKTLIDEVFGWRTLEKKASQLGKTFFDFMREDMGIDTQIFGDISRLFRVENTLNLKSGRYCVNVREIKENGYDDSEKNKKAPYILGDKLLNLQKSTARYKPFSEDYEIDEISDDVEIKNLRPCVQSMLLKPSPTHQERYVACYDLIDLLAEGTQKRTKKIEDVIFKLFKRLNWKDFNPTVTRYHIRWCMNSGRSGYTCEQIKRMGLCVKSKNCEFEEKNEN